MADGRLLRHLVTWSMLVALAGWLAPEQARAQQPATDWSPPVIIAETSGKLAGSAMTLVADGFGHVHLFFPHTIEESGRGSIDYMTWDGSGWSEPVDILLDPRGGNPSTVRATIDPQQVVHLLFSGQGNWLIHTSAQLADVGSPWGWSEPKSLTTGFPDADIVSGPDGVLYVAYAELPATGFVKLISSSDDGLSWSRPVTVASVSEPETAPNEVRLAIDGAGRLHAAWTEYHLPGGWPLAGAFYTRSTDGGTNWEAPRRVAEADHGQIGLGTAGEDGVHLVWRSTIGGDGTFHQHSTNGGDEWSSPMRYDDRGGLSGLPSFAVDSGGRLHFVTGRGTYGSWQQGRPGAYEDLRTEEVSSRAVRSGGERAVLAITAGNRLHVVFETDFNTLWYTSKALDVPTVPTVTPVVPIKVAHPTATPEAADPTPAAEATPAPTDLLVAAVDPPDAAPSSQTAVYMLGVLAAAGVVGIILAANLLRAHRR